jgi:hypothetical protein
MRVSETGRGALGTIGGNASTMTFHVPAFVSAVASLPVKALK